MTDRNTPNIRLPQGFDDDMAAAEVRPSSGGVLPPGNYVGYVAKVTLEPFKDNPDDPIFTIWLRVIGGEQHGGSQRKSYFIADPGRFGYFKTDMARLGVEVNNLGMTWSQWLYYKRDDLLKRVVQFANVEKVQEVKGVMKTFLNTYINDAATVEIPADLLALDFPAVTSAPSSVVEGDMKDFVDPFANEG